MSPNEYLEFARTCVRWAEETLDPKAKQDLVDMSKLWMQTALEVERVHAIGHRDTPPYGAPRRRRHRRAPG
jgi:hypothetical protein